MKMVVSVLVYNVLGSGQFNNEEAQQIDIPGGLT